MINGNELKGESISTFADSGLRTQERLVKSALAIRIAGTLRARHLTQIRAARILKIDQPRISRLLNGQLAEFSMARLIRFLTLLGVDVEILLKPASGFSSQGHVRVGTAT
jgi:predicted XRE-type DNA-binding protein